MIQLPLLAFQTGDPDITDWAGVVIGSAALLHSIYVDWKQRAAAATPRLMAEVTKPQEGARLLTITNTGGSTAYIKEVTVNGSSISTFALIQSGRQPPNTIGSGSTFPVLFSVPDEDTHLAGC